MLSGVATRRHFFSTATHLGCTFHLPLSTSTSSKKKKTAFFLPTKTYLPKNTNQSTMADCGCAPKCACGAEKIGEFRLPFSFERGLCFSVGLKNSTKKKLTFLSLSLFSFSLSTSSTRKTQKTADCKCCCSACGEKCGCEKCACSKKDAVGGACCAGGEGCCEGGCSCGTG